MLYEKLLWAKEHLKPHQSEYVVIFEDPEYLEAPASILIPDPNWMACALHGGILPPVWVYHELQKDEQKPNFTKHDRLHLLSDTEPVPPLTEEEAITYLIFKDIPERVWNNSSNRQYFKIVKKSNLPKDRTFRDAWRLNNERN